MKRKRPPATEAPPQAAAAAALPSRWLFGPLPDLAFGCGGAYAVVFAVLALGGSAMRELLPLGIALLPFNLVSGAHYGATALRAYERSDDRRAYAAFTLWTTILLGAAFVGGLASYGFGSWVITVYLTWSPWHYAGQNFGVAMTFLRRRGVTVTPMARRFLHLSFITSYLLAALALHVTTSNVSYAPTDLEAGVYTFLPLGPRFGITPSLGNVLIAITAALYCAVTAAAVICLRTKASFRDLMPSLVLIATQALWFSIPVVARQWGVLGGLEPFATETAFYAFLWIGFGHAFQYLWITSYFARKSGRANSLPLFFGKSLLAGTAMWWVPALIFAPGLLGRLPYDAGLATMVASLVNLHHFVLDGVIWKLRDARIAGILVRSELTGTSAAPLRPAVRASLWVGGIVLLVVASWSTFLTEFGFNRNYLKGDFVAAARASDQLAAIGQSSAEQRLQLGHAALELGDLPAARKAFEQSLAIQETPWGFTGLGEVSHREGDLRTAGELYAKALALNSEHTVATFYSGLLALEAGQLERGRRLVARARALAANDRTAPHELVDEIERVLAEAQ